MENDPLLAARSLPSEGFGTAPESERSSVDDVAVDVGTIHIRRPQRVSGGVHTSKAEFVRDRGGDM